jgi:hypothetical protein
VPVAVTVVVVVAAAAWAAAAEEEEEGTKSTTAPTSMSARERVIWLVAILLATERTGELFLSVYSCALVRLYGWKGWEMGSGDHWPKLYDIIMSDTRGDEDLLWWKTELPGADYQEVTWMVVGERCTSQSAKI